MARQAFQDFSGGIAVTCQEAASEMIFSRLLVLPAVRAQPTSRAVTMQ
jgi:hypothetical protein